jgi:hypothetical protein
MSRRLTKTEGLEQYRSIRSRRQLDRLTAAEQEARSRALDALSEARLHGLSLSAATRAAGTTIPTVVRYAAPAVERLPSGRYRVLPDDRLYRRLRVISTEGPVWVDVRSSRTARLASRHANAVRAYGLHGDASVLSEFRGRRVGGVELAVEQAALASFAVAGELDAFELYDEAAR